MVRSSESQAGRREPARGTASREIDRSEIDRREIDRGETDRGEIDLRALGAALRRRRRVYLLPTLVAFVLIAIFVTVATPRFTAETQLLLENQETFFTRPDRVNLPSDMASQLDETAVASQVQLVSSPDIARKVIAELKLRNDDEFDPLARGMGPVTRVLVLLGLAHDPTRDPADARVVQAFLQKLTVFSPPKTRVITIQFTSRDPALSARIANTVAEDYIEAQSSAKRTMAQSSAEALSSQIADLRKKLARADDDRESYRLSSGLLAGSNNMTISGQQLADINSDLSKARTTQADAQAKASMIRELVKAGKAADVAEVTNNDIVRRIWDQRAVAQAQLALESRTLLDGHPRIKELTAQVQQYDLALKAAAKQAASTLENEAKIAGARVANLETVLAQQKKVAGVANVDEVHLRALERIAQGYKDQLESSTTKYEEALARQSSTATPADARIVTRAATPQDPSYPKKLPFILFGTIATFVFAIGFVLATELLSGRAEPGYRSNADDRRGPLPVARPADRDPSPDPVVSATPIEERAVAPIESTPRLSAWADDEALAPRAAPLRRDWLRWVRLRSKSPVEPAPRVEPDEAELVFAPVETPTTEDFAEPVRKSAGVLAAATAYLREFGRSAAQSRPSSDAATDGADEAAGYGWDGETDAAVPSAPAERVVPATVADDGLGLVDRIVEAHVPGRGLHIVVTAYSSAPGPNEGLIRLGRSLSDRGRSILVDLNRTPAKLAALCGGEADGLSTIMTMSGLAELLAGDASFAEVIHRDKGSRLHFIPTGMGDADFRDFDLILDALSETYDFVVLMIPSFPQSEIARVMAPYADFMVLAAAPDADRRVLAGLEAELVEAGARTVIGLGIEPPQARHVA